MIEIAIILGISLSAFLFAYLATNISKNHGALQIFFLIISLFMVVVNIDTISRMAETAVTNSSTLNFSYVPEATLDNISRTMDAIFNALIFMIILVVLYFLLMLIIASGKIANPFKREEDEMEVNE